MLATSSKSPIRRFIRAAWRWMRVVSIRMPAPSGAAGRGLLDDRRAHHDGPQQVPQVVADQAEKVVAIGERIVRPHALDREETVGLLTFEGQQLRPASRAACARSNSSVVSAAARSCLEHGVFEHAFPRHGDARRQRRIALLHAQIRLLARFEQHRIRFLARAAEHLVGAFDHRIPARGQRAIALLAFVPEALVGLLALGRWVGLAPRT